MVLVIFFGSEAFFFAALGGKPRLLCIFKKEQFNITW